MTEAEADHKAQQLLARAQSLSDIGRWQEALPLLEQALALAPGDFEALCRSALCYLNLGQLPQALERATQAIQANPHHEWGFRLRSIILRKQKKHKDALSAARTAVQLAPEEPFALYVLALSLLDNKATSEAAQTATRLREVAPDNALAHELSGLVALEQKQWAESERYFRHALTLDPTSYEAMNNLGVVLQSQGRKKEATETYFRAAQLNPTDPLAKYNLKRLTRRALPSIFLLFVVARLLSYLVTSNRVSDSISLWLTVGFLALLLGGVMWWRRRDKHQLSAEVQRFLHLESRRDRRLNLHYGGLKLGAYVCGIGTLTVLLPLCLFAGLSWWLGVPLLALGVAGTAWLMVRVKRMTKEMEAQGLR